MENWKQFYETYVEAAKNRITLFARIACLKALAP